MTAINVVFEKERVHLLTDGAGYTNEGMPIGFAQKAVAMPSLHAVVAAQGQVVGTGIFAQTLTAAFTDFDHMADGIEAAMLAEYDAQCWRMGGAAKVTPFRIILAGWSMRDSCPRGFTFDAGRDACEFEWMENDPGDWRMLPSLTPEEERNLELQNVMVAGTDFVGRFDPIRHGIPLMEAQRRMPISPIVSETGVAVSIVGGFVQACEITATDIKQRIIHRWADDAGRIIEPEAFVEPKGVALLRPPSGLNRQQRRAWERQHGKVSA